MSDQDMTSDETLKLLWDQVETRPPQAESKLRNCGLKRLLNRLKYAIAEAKHYQDVAQRATDENTALQAVVDKLPKDKNGAPICPGDRLVDPVVGVCVVEIIWKDGTLGVELEDCPGELRMWTARCYTHKDALAASNHSVTEAEGE